MKELRYLVVAVFCSFALIGCRPLESYSRQLESDFVKRGFSVNYYENDSLRIRFMVGGEGPPVMLIHGFGSQGHVTWRKQVKELMQSHQVVIPELLFFGESTGEVTPSLINQGEILWKIANLLKFREIHLVGISYGGFVALEMVNTRPKRVASLMLIDCPGMEYTYEEAIRWSKRHGASEPYEIFVPESKEGVQRMVDLALYKDRKLLGFAAQEMIQEIDKNRSQRIALLKDLLRQGSRYDDFPFKEIPPTMIVWGAHDEVFPVESGQRLSEKLEAPLKVFNYSGHAPIIEEPEAFNKLLLEFLEENQ